MLQHYATLWNYWDLFLVTLKKSSFEALKVLEEVGRGRGRAEGNREQRCNITLPHMNFSLL